MHSILSQTLISNLQQIKVYLNLYSNCDSVDFWIWVITALFDCVEQQGCKMSEYYHIITAQNMIDRYKVHLIEGNPKSICRFELKYNTISHLLIESCLSKPFRAKRLVRYGHEMPWVCILNLSFFWSNVYWWCKVVFGFSLTLLLLQIKCDWLCNRDITHHQTHAIWMLSSCVNWFSPPWKFSPILSVNTWYIK